MILFDGRSADPLWQVPAAGGKAQALSFGEDTDPTLGAGWPEFLPDGKHFLFTLGDSAENPRYIETLPRRGYRFVAGRPMVKEDWQNPGENWVLLVK